MFYVLQKASLEPHGDYQALREGKVVIASAPDREVYARDKIVFPLADLAEKALENFSDPSVESLDPQEPLPVPFHR